ncbi:MAG: hypothetical protein ACKO2L_19750 [Planctomycetaceae bacterium]
MSRFCLPVDIFHPDQSLARLLVSRKDAKDGQMVLISRMPFKGTAKASPPWTVWVPCTLAFPVRRFGGDSAP